MNVHVAMPMVADGGPPASPIKIGTAHGFKNLGCPAERVWDWLRTTPVWSRLIAEAPAASGDWSLDFAGHANGVEGGEACLAIALPVMCQFYCAGKWSSVRQSWSEIEILVAVNRGRHAWDGRLHRGA